MCKVWVDYDPAWLVELAKDQGPELVKALTQCTKALVVSAAYISFVPADAPNQPGSEWQFDINVILEDPERGSIVLDLLKDGRVGGVEFLSQLY